jgi:type II secretory pathway pseudopilin PulG
MKNFSVSSKAKGISLIEALMTLAIIGVMAAVAVPLLFDTKEDVTRAQQRRNAQEIISVCATAQAAGLDFVVPGNLEKSIENVIVGGAPTSGVFRGRLFRVPGITVQDISKVSKFIRLENGSLIYHHSGGMP